MTARVFPQGTRIRKAVFPVAGLGTRFLPATKANPKEMLPVVDKPLVQYAVEEAVAAGVEVLVFINGRNKDSIPNHFDTAYELEVELEQRGKQDLLKLVRGIVPEGVACVYIRQAEALGLGHAVSCARPVIGDEPFAVLLADDLIDGYGTSALGQMAEAFDGQGGSMVAVQQVPHERTHQYGIVDLESGSDRVGTLHGIVEKPAPDAAPSDLGVIGRYILTPRIFDKIAEIPRGAGGEIQLTDAIGALLAEEPVFSYQFRGKRFDCGDKLGYLQATVEYGLKHPELSEKFRDYLREVAGSGLLE